ncbi:CG13077 [Drosophila busckii]|uniref:ascorbate ferrireductase (transmembrane) n=1 Tax=Drosophila busckii TaxID=30019 RepID=A0A0M5J922_DROBS|nr:cytochrome b561 domain-containing protein 2 [Drosophila busckii]ALC38931.1 CG13077 [Drosophila busckii]
MPQPEQGAQALSSLPAVVDYGSVSKPEPHSELPLKTREQRSPSFVVVREATSGPSYARMTHLPHAEAQQPLQRLEFFLNIVNQMCIGFITIYISYLTLRTGLAGTGLHAWLVTIGFSFFMAQGIMVHYSNNVLTSSYKRHTKTTIHWVTMVLGGGCGAAGALIKMIQKGFLLQSTHGRLGLAAFVLCLVTMCSGLAALFSMRIKKLLAPLLNKAFHNFLGIAVFVVALVTQFYGYETKYFKTRTQNDFQVLIKCLTLTSLVLTVIGPLKSLYHRLQSIARQF